MVVHLTAATHHITDIILVAIAGTAGNRVLFEHMHMLTPHLAITHQIAGSGQGCQTGADDISGFMIDTLGLLRVCKSFVIATGIIHKERTSLILFSIFMLSSWQ